MRILVIGGTGFIGPFLVRELERLGHEVAVFHRGNSAVSFGPWVRRILGDRRSLGEYAGALRKFAPEVVIDVVLSSGRQAEALMGVFRGVARRVVALSSGDVYRAMGVIHRFELGPLEPLPLTEESPLRQKLQVYPPEQLKSLQNVLGWLDDEYDKIPVERAVLGNPELPGTVLRLPMVYGPGDPLHRFFPVLKRIDDGRGVIPFEEMTAAFRSPRGYVEEVAAAIALASTSDPAAGRIYNVAEAESYSELEWARRIAKVDGWRGEFRVLPTDRAPAHPVAPGNAEQHLVMDASRIRSELGYRETIPLEERIRRTIAWERVNPPAETQAQLFDYAAEDAALAS